MSDERQNLQLELALHGAGEGEAQISREQGTESRVVKGVTENPATERLMEEVCEASNLRKALQRVKANRGAPGVDGMTVEGLAVYFGQHEAELREQLPRRHLSAAASEASRNREARRWHAQVRHSHRTRPARAPGGAAGAAAAL